MRINRRNVIQMMAVAPLVNAGPAGSQAGGGDAVLIKIEDRKDGTGAFVPDKITVKRGQTIRWVNNGILIHTVTCDKTKAENPAKIMLPVGAQPFASEDLFQENEYSHTFTTAGTYRYICAYHEAMGMFADVTVT